VRSDVFDFCTDDLDWLQEELGRWRERQSGRTRLPKELWRSATELARKLGVSQVSRQLRLSYNDLRRRVEEGAEGTARGKEPAFVELTWQNRTEAVRRDGFRAELEKDRLTLHLGDNAGAVMAVVEAFWRRQE